MLTKRYDSNLYGLYGIWIHCENDMPAFDIHVHWSSFSLVKPPDTKIVSKKQALL